jgi:hypothetical protein
MKLTDEILNKYLDGELSSDELKELNSLIEVDPDALNTLKTHKFVDKTLSKIETEPAPVGFTQRVMNIISSASSVRNKKFYFFRFIVSLFGLLISGTIFFIINSLPKPVPESDTSLKVVDTATKFLSENFGGVSDLLNNNTLMMIGGMLTIILLISGYFVLESHKSFKQKLENSFH